MSVHSRISVSEVCSGPIPFTEEVKFWKDLGVNNVGMISPKLEPIGWDTTLVGETGLRVSNVGTEERFVADAVEFAASMGADSVWLEPGTIGSRTWEEAAKDFCQRIAPAVERAHQLGIPFAVQPTNALRLDLSFIFTLRDSLELARAAGTGVVLELQCCWYERGLKELVRKHVDMLTLVQISDYQLGSLSTPDRSVIGDGDIPLERIVAMILDAGYEGMFDLEILGPKIEAESYLSATRRSLERASEMFDRIGI